MALIALAIEVASVAGRSVARVAGAAIARRPQHRAVDVAAAARRGQVRADQREARVVDVVVERGHPANGTVALLAVGAEARVVRETRRRGVAKGAVLLVAGVSVGVAAMAVASSCEGAVTSITSAASWPSKPRGSSAPITPFFP